MAYIYKMKLPNKTMLLGKNTQLLAGYEDQGRRTVRANCDIHRS